MIDEGVTTVLAARATTRNGDDSHTSGTGVRRNERTVRECTYQDFMKCQPLFFRGTEGVVDLTQWFERMETVFHISNCTVENQVKFATCTLMGISLTWWNSHGRTVTNEVAYAMTWTDLKKKMTTKYCPRNEIKKIEAEMWNLKTDKDERVCPGGCRPDLRKCPWHRSRKPWQELLRWRLPLQEGLPPVEEQEPGKWPQEVSATRMSHLFAHIYLQRETETSREDATARCTDRQTISRSISEDLPVLPPYQTMERSHRSSTWCGTGSMGTLSIGPKQNERLGGSTTRAFRQRLYKTSSSRWGL
ncbi:reverse transcriptase domain-containing protein [Tanacetum coccineum]